MSNYDQLVRATQQAQLYLLSAPIIEDVAQGHASKAMYQSFLVNAFHHVRHTVPLMMAAGARLDPARTTLVCGFKDYIEEEFGHECWILQDLFATGADTQAIEISAPNHETELMVAYVRDYISHVHPLGFLGMVHVLEGTSTNLATATADLVQQSLGLPDEAFSYLRSHGDLDIEHVDFFKQLLELLDESEMGHVIHVATRVYRLYGDVLRSVARRENAVAVDAGEKNAA